MSTLTLRDYQEDAIAAVEAGSGRQLVACPTGSGKTVIFSELLRRRGGTALILAHRDELLQQAAGKLRFVAPELALNVGFVQAGRNDVGAPIVVGSVQTLASAKRLAQLPTTFDTVIVDEAHHAAADSYRRILAHVADSSMIVGFTATPERADDKDLRNVFDSLAYARSLEDMIREGYLCDLRALRVTLEDLDLKKVKKSGGDYAAGALGHAMEEAHAAEHVVAAYLQHGKGLRTVAFFPTVALSQEAAEAFREAGVNAAHLDGTTPIDERRTILEDLSSGRLDLISNVGVLTEGYDEPSLECVIIAAPTRSRIKYCLDAQTEILTREGFKRQADVAVGDDVAAMDPTTGEVSWRPAVAKVVRPLTVGESMVAYTSPTMDVRVSDQHRMLWRSRRSPSATWHITEAATLAARRVEFEMPVSGEQTAPGVPLTDDELRFVGWVMSDGTINRKTSQVVISQAAHQPHHAAIRSCLDGCGFRYGVITGPRATQHRATSDLVRYTISKGDPKQGGPLLGWGRLAPFIDKALSPALDAMTSQQLAVLLEALHLGDGAKQLGQSWTRRTYHIATASRTMADRLQSLCVRRGFRCNVATGDWNEKPIYMLHVKRGVSRHLGGAGYSDRPVFRSSPSDPDEEVWCVENDLGTLITRRNGKVAIVGNCQMVGRGTRLYPGKESCLILDLAGVSDDLTLQSVGMLFDLKAPPKPGETALKARDRELAEEDAILEAEQALDSERREAARIRKLAAERRNLFDRDSIQWIRHGERWALGLKDALLVLDHFAEGTAGWRVLLLHENANSPTGMSYRVAAQNLDLGYAQGAAEHLIRTSGAVALADKHAPWRSQPATKGQRGRLWHLGVRLPAGSTKGQAADLITQTIAEQRLERFDRATQSKETVAA